jgi:hypothetical protein
VDPQGLEAGHHLPGKAGGHGGGDAHLEAQALGLLQEEEEVWPRQGVAPCGQEDGLRGVGGQFSEEL